MSRVRARMGIALQSLPGTGIKYPHIFKANSVMLLNKIDLLPYLKFDIEKCIAYARQVNPAIQVFQVSAPERACWSGTTGCASRAGQTSRYDRPYHPTHRVPDRHEARH